MALLQPNCGCILPPCPQPFFGTAGLKKHSAAAFMDSANGLR
jgi:hypothetical protein